MHLKFSELSFEDVATYLSFVTEDDKPEVELYLNAAKSYIREYTSLTDEELDEKQYFIMPTLMLTSSFYENKSIEMNENLSVVYKNLLHLKSDKSE